MEKYNYYEFNAKLSDVEIIIIQIIYYINIIIFNSSYVFK